jgi:hypothetical protein
MGFVSDSSASGRQHATSQPVLQRIEAFVVDWVPLETGGSLMKGTGSRLGLMGLALFWAGWIALSGTSTATLEHQKQAKAAGVEVKTCQYCHVDKLPKKDKGAHEPNDVGKWLIAEKEKRGAKEIDGAWVKDYPGNKK